MVMDHHSYLSLAEMLYADETDAKIAMLSVEQFDYDKSKDYIYALIGRTLGNQGSFGGIAEWEERWKEYAPTVMENLVAEGLWGGGKFTLLYEVSDKQTPEESLDSIRKEFKELLI